ncbi:hypothetical protein G4B88_004367 [Cannabis sativa]|uniref:Uncharacterized protein n=1 Tax=Cannabis sativa TaxID=3483 RepID=A0A7J6HZW5_CANSA|nr:hypothetical protein G4B88_004367 [Cannabis sativa]
MYNSYKNPISTNETNPNITQFISTIKKSISNLNKSQTFYDLSYLSQAYNRIKDYFVGTQEIFSSELRHRNPSNYGINQWKNWLKGYYQYDLSQSKLIPPKSRNIVKKNSIVQNKHFKKFDSNEKNLLINSKKQKKMLKNKINMIFYHIILLIMKIRRPHLFMNFHYKKIIIKRSFIITKKK